MACPAAAVRAIGLPAAGENEAVRGQRAVAGIDLGTSGVKVVVIGPDRDVPGPAQGLPGWAVRGRGRAAYPVGVPARGRAETDPEAWWAALRHAVRDALAEAGNAGIGALAVAGQMHGVVLTGDDGVPLRPAILWLDQRAAAEAAHYDELPGALTGVLGNRPAAGMAGPLLCWLAAHEPGALGAARWALPPKDWLRLRLTGQAATDPTDASGTLLFDLAGDRWADELIAALGLPRDKLPPVRDPAGVGGRLLPAAAGELGLPPGIPVAIGAADTAAALHAAGLREREAMLTLGSGGQWVVPEEAFRPAGTTNLFRAVGGGYYRLAPVQNVGVTLDWVRTLLGVSWEELYAAASRPPRPGAPVFTPRLTPERWDPAATGAWTGLTLAHRREDLLRSALDGVAALLRQRLEDLRAAGHHPESVLLGGGGSDHPAWQRLLEETLALPVRRSPAGWLTAHGAARLAAARLAAAGNSGSSTS